MNDQTLTVVSWNTHKQFSAWDYVDTLRERHGAQVALLQEAIAPPADTVCWPAHDDPDAWAITVPPGMPGRRFASAVAVLDPDLTMSPITVQPLAASPYGDVAASHPGQFSAATVSGPGMPDVLVISLYGLWDTMTDNGDIYAEASLHRAISDLTPLLQARRHQRVILAGDFNIYRNWSTADRIWGPRYDTVFDRLAAYGLRYAGPQREADKPPLAGCRCRLGESCTHVQTYRHQRKQTATPYQDDYFFASEAVTVEACHASDDAAAWTVSDHLPLFMRARMS